MNRLRQVLAGLQRDESGQDLIEYALLAALIALAATVGMSTVASDINNAFTLIGSKVSVNVGSLQFDPVLQGGSSCREQHEPKPDDDEESKVLNACNLPDTRHLESRFDRIGWSL
jgi:pilus assembly protein Flp/PilA